MESSKLSLSDWDVADYLQTEEDIALFLEVAREQDPDDLAFMEQVTKEVARARRLNEKRTAPNADSPEWTDQMVKDSVRIDDLPSSLQQKLQE